MSSVLFSGIVGETGVCKLLNQIQTKTYVKYIHNLPVKGVRSFQQVDIVLLTLYGFFCIEVKNWDCTVYVSPRSRYWQVEYPTRNLVVPSPIIQNGEHCRYLQRTIFSQFNSLIVFSDKARLVDPLTYTIHANELIPFILSRDKIYSEEIVNDSYEKLLNLKHKTEATMIASFILKGNDRLEVL